MHSRADYEETIDVLRAARLGGEESETDVLDSGSLAPYRRFCIERTIDQDDGPTARRFLGATMRAPAAYLTVLVSDGAHLCASVCRALDADEIEQAERTAGRAPISAVIS